MTAVARGPDIADLLAFYASAGVDEALEEQPLNRFAEAASKPPERASATVTPPTGENAALPRSTSLSCAGLGERQAAAPALRAPSATATVPDEQQAALARHLATTAATLDELRQHMAAFDGCNLKLTAKNLVFADGNPNAAVMLVGETPERDEDIEGLPFVGQSGRLLDRMLAAIGLDRTSAYIANVIPWRPPGNRTPTPHETEICRPFIERQIELVNPKMLVNLGGLSANILLGTTEAILRLRGNWRVHTTAAGIAIPAMPTLHPAYLLKNPAHKKLAWRDFLEVKAKLRTLG
ncbi:uracil-DNA glycosylase [Mesorhizobium sp.]|uniref:uracil-DNA glycosylase n=1 Tax=Mesorhizobium sp. TaxID=1871066 RepID=UPI000FE79CA4|nr:uracil-DNA glycosylase [Mesorhizobium sp.]RWK43363.1 MAG: uracil-DNA glycosylase [Mesorhizobium sp.]RWK69886.1 MAG: uracil-DNA glycosylase [Mesorhizobium sp.]RWK76643.1 MAG: uracil-DNA glycosylase [Mesorhizobium sp.]RWK80191.1 MAG: uracil-DNA glycosylase [Mesorhizobium sp.]RWL03462.1 MAG: uracil-DNA glycosylase [Mesorhizobium sp.]